LRACFGSLLFPCNLDNKNFSTRNAVLESESVLLETLHCGRGTLVSCLAVEVFGLLCNSHVRLLRRSKESQGMKEVFLPSSQNYSHLRFLLYVANPGVV